MAERARLFAVTGDGVARLELEGASVGEPERMLHGAGARCLAIDQHEPDRVYVGTFDDGLLLSSSATRGLPNCMADWPSGDAPVRCSASSTFPKLNPSKCPQRPATSTVLA